MARLRRREGGCAQFSTFPHLSTRQRGFGGPRSSTLIHTVDSMGIGVDERGSYAPALRAPRCYPRQKDVFPYLCTGYPQALWIRRGPVRNGREAMPCSHGEMPRSPEERERAARWRNGSGTLHPVLFWDGRRTPLTSAHSDDNRLPAGLAGQMRVSP